MLEGEFGERGQLVEGPCKQEYVNLWACLRASGGGGLYVGLIDASWGYCIFLLFTFSCEASAMDQRQRSEVGIMGYARW